MLNFANLNFCYDPYPIGLAKNVLEQSFYYQLVQSFPPPNLFEYKRDLGHKYSLSQVNNSRLYHKFIGENEPWRKLHRWIKREQFPAEILEILRAHNIEFDLTRPVFGGRGKGRALLGALRSARQVFSRSDRLSARFEFSMLPADKGCIKPHTDNPQKLVTLVVSMSGEKEWNPNYGGGTEVMRPRDITRNYNFVNHQLEFEEVETIRVFDYRPNQCILFIKTFNSLHGVRPMMGVGSSLMRKTLTINIEYEH
jgi:hypothetical protein